MTFLSKTIVQNDVKAAGGCNNELMTLFQRMASAALTPWNIIKIKNPFDLERDVAGSFNESQVPAFVQDLG